MEGRGRGNFSGMSQSARLFCFLFFLNPRQRALAFSLEQEREPASARPERLELHHELVVAAVVCHVGLPAVLEMVGQNVVPVLLLFRAVERPRPVRLRLLQRRVVKGQEVLRAGGQLLLLLVGVVLSLTRKEKWESLNKIISYKASLC